MRTEVPFRLPESFW